MTTREFLENRYSWSKDGIYIAHQPIYGYKSGYSEPHQIVKYIRTSAILDEIRRTKGWYSFLDVGGGEGYLCGLVKAYFRWAEISMWEISENATRRAKEIYGIESFRVDISSSLYSDKRDIIVCSETLEHIQNPQAAINNLLLFTNIKLIITVPKETSKEIDQNRLEPHAHVNRFNEHSFDYLLHSGFDVQCKKIQSTILKPFRKLAEKYLGLNAAKCIVWLDKYFAKFGNKGLMFIITIKKTQRPKPPKSFMDIKTKFHQISK